MLQGLLSCAKCDGQLWSQTSRTGPRYQDNARHRKGVCPNKRASVKCEVIDRQVEELLKSLVLPDDWVAAAHTMVEQEPMSLDSTRERRSLTERLSRLKELYLDGNISRNRYDTERAELAAKVESLDYKHTECLDAAASQLVEFRDSWVHATPRERAAFCQVVFERIWVDLDEGTITAVKPRRPSESSWLK